MNQYAVDTLMGEFFIVAEYYSKSRDGERYLFWIGKKIIHSFLVYEVVDIAVIETRIP